MVESNRSESSIKSKIENNMFSVLSREKDKLFIEVFVSWSIYIFLHVTWSYSADNSRLVLK